MAKGTRRPPQATGGAVPADLTSFVGRRDEVAQVKRLLSTTRMVTLTGVGGVGKTRIAWRVAQELSRAFTDGVWAVELAALRDPVLLAQAVVDALPIPEQAAGPPLTAATEYLRDRQALLVLDNCEHLLGACAELVGTLLRAAPDVRVLATSRQALRVPGEHLLPVLPLPVPGPSTSPTATAWTEYAALTLLTERAAAAVPGFRVTAENRLAAARLCRLLEGIPLAIELAAVRLRVLSVTELADRLDRRFQLLTGGSRSMPVRHRTLQTTIDWSFDLCTPAEQQLWTRTSVFAGGFDLEAAEAVCGDEDLPAEDILDMLAGLVDKSVIVREEKAGRSRFRLLETLREYGRDRLRDSGHEASLRFRHRDWCVQLVEKAAGQWFGPDQEQWWTRLRLEQPNLRLALEFCLAEPGQARTGMHLAGLPWFLWVGGPLAEGRQWLDRLLALDPAPSPERARALTTGGCVTALQGDLLAGRAMLEEAQSLALQLGDPAALAYATHMLGMSALFTDPTRAGELLREALALYGDDTANGTPDLVVALRLQLAMSYVFTGDLSSAYEEFQLCQSLCEPAGETWLRSVAVKGVALVEFCQGELTEAAAHARESLRMRRVFRDVFFLSMTLDVLAWILAAQNRAQQAAVLLGAASRQWSTIGRQMSGSKDWTARIEQCEERARDSLGGRGFAAAFSRGTELDVDAAIDYALGAEPHRAAEPATPEGPVLTRRQQEIAELVAEGLSNMEIAQRLVISRRTAEGHVEQILTKLDFRSRTQIATWVAERRSV